MVFAGKTHKKLTAYVSLSECSFPVTLSFIAFIIRSDFNTKRILCQAYKYEVLLTFCFLNDILIKTSP